MKKVIRTIIPGLAQILVLAAFALSDRAGAQQFILDSGTPTSSTFPILNNSQWFAAEFSATAGQTITQLSTYLTSLTGNGNNFAFDIYQDSYSGISFLGTRNAQLSPFLEFTATGTYTGPGWSSTTVSWVVPATGNYWVAIQGNTAGNRNLPNYDVQEETSATTGTVPALAFATDTGTQFSSVNAPAIGLQVTATAVPEPATWSLIVVAGILGRFVWVAKRLGLVSL
ncbi:MAG TPA: hypothetical protein VMH87_08800 [Pseudomonadales bacterium]|nr:hypothetical protein [Pseudomonadales bacterium]